MVKVAWIGKFSPGADFIYLMRKIIGKYFKFDNFGGLYDDEVKILEDYDYIFGNTNLYGVYNLVKMNKRFFKVMSIKFAHRKYRPLGFFEVYTLDLDFNPKIGEKLLVISRHNIPSMIDKKKVVMHYTKFVGSSDTVVWLMRRYNADDLFWIFDLWGYYELINRFGVTPLRTVTDKNRNLNLVRIVKVDGKMYFFNNRKVYKD